MAETPGLDPQRSLKRALDQLTLAVKRLDKHFESLQAEDQGTYLEAQKESVAVKKIREAGWSVAQARKPDQPQQAKPGSLNTEASTIPEIIQSLKAADARTPNEKAVDRAASIVRAAGSVGTFSSQAGVANHDAAIQSVREAMGEGDEEEGPPTEPLGWMSQKERDHIQESRLELPGTQNRNATYKMRRNARAAKNLAARGSVAAESKGMMGTASAFGGISKFAGIAEDNAGILGPALGLVTKGYQAGNEAVQTGVGLGETGENVPGGQFLPGGFRNPLAILSEAGKQGIGQKVSAIENALKGNLGLGESEELQKGLSRLGFRNTEAGGILSHIPLIGGLFPNSGTENTLMELGGTAKREGLGTKQYLQMAEGIRFGGGSIEQLTENIKGLGQAAKDAGTSTNVVAESMATYAQLTSKQGTKTEQEKKGREIFEGTGKPASMTFETNETALGQALAAMHGVLPGTIGATSGRFTEQNSAQTLKLAAQMTNAFLSPTTNDEEGTPFTQTSKNAMHAALMSKIFGTNNQASRNFLEHEDRVLHMPTAQNKASIAVHGAEVAAEHHAKLPEMGKEWGNLWNSASRVGIQPGEYQKDFKLDHGGLKSRQALQEQLGKLAGNQEQEKLPTIGLSPEARKFFKLNYPKQSAEMEANEGGTSKSQNATKKSTGTHANPLKSVGDVAQGAGETLGYTALHAAEHIPIAGAAVSAAEHIFG